MTQKEKSPWLWLAALYFMEGLPNVIVSVAAVVFYSNMGLGDAAVAALTSMLYLPWVIKPFWSPLVDSVSTKRTWILSGLVAFALAFFLIALAPLCGAWIALSIAGFWILGFASATFDIASDGFYMIALSRKSQAFFVGIRNSFYRIAMVFGQGGLIWLVGALTARAGLGQNAAWSAAFFACALLSVAGFFLLRISLPKPAGDDARSVKSAAALYSEFKSCFVGFFARSGIFAILAYVLFYRFAEAQLSKIVPIFLKAPREAGGLGFSLETFGMFQSLSVVALFTGGILGGIYISKKGLRGSFLTMALFMNVPNLIYVLLALFQPQSSWLVASGLCAEQFGYGFGFAGYMMYLIRVSDGAYKTAFYAICTGLMALGLVLPGALSGLISEYLGYLNFFVWVLASTMVSFAVTIIARQTLKRD